MSGVAQRNILEMSGLRNPRAGKCPGGAWTSWLSAKVVCFAFPQGHTVRRRNQLTAFAASLTVG